MKEPTQIVAFTPNLSLGRTLELERKLTPGELHRVRVTHEAAGGGGVNLARVVRALGGEAIVAGFLAGWNGKKFRRLLSSEGLRGVFREVKGETRECHILLDGLSHPTEVYESGPTVTGEDWEELVRALPPGRIVISGSLPPGISTEAFRTLLRRFPSRPVVDTSGSTLVAALEAGVALVKCNQAELADVIGRDPAGGVEEANELFREYQVPILLTQGAAGAVLIDHESYWAKPPEVSVRNPVCSGDSLLGAFLWGLAQGHTSVEALRTGVAAGAENARATECGVTAEGVLEIRERTQAGKIK
jgi:1-phosphofructokinase family hexose kinase